MTISTTLLIVGAGPVGMCAALEAAQRGVEVTLLEARAPGEPPSAKCNTVAARTMEVFRRFGIADAVRAAGLPDDYPTDTIYCTSVAGIEMTRITMPSRSERMKPGFPDSHWRTPEPMVRVSQIYLEPILANAVQKTIGITVCYGVKVTSYRQDAEGVDVEALDSAGQIVRYRAQYLIGADGGRSTIRKTMGIRLTGDAELGHMRTTLIRAPGLLHLWGNRRPAWMSWVVNHKVRGNVVAIDGQDTWLVHRMLPHGERDFESLDLQQSIRDVLGVGSDFAFDVLSHEDWIGRRLVAERVRDRRVFIAGDAAHLWVPFAGYGMNAGIADGVQLAWLIANVLDGWAAPKMLDAYEAERHPITEQVSRYAMQSMIETMEALGRNHVPSALSSRINPAGIAMRAVMGPKLHKLNVPQFAPEGLNFGYYYSSSPLIAYDEEAPPDYTMGSATPSTVPGCRLPHFWLPNGQSVYDKFGVAYTLLRFDANVAIDHLVRAAASAGMPLTVLEVERAPGDKAFRHALVLVRRDQHVAWRGDSLPKDVESLVRTLTANVESEREAVAA